MSKRVLEAEETACIHCQQQPCQCLLTPCPQCHFDMRTGTAHQCPHYYIALGDVPADPASGAAMALATFVGRVNIAEDANESQLQTWPDTYTAPAAMHAITTTYPMDVVAAVLLDESAPATGAWLTAKEHLMPDIAVIFPKQRLHALLRDRYDEIVDGFMRGYAPQCVNYRGTCEHLYWLMILYDMLCANFSMDIVMPEIPGH